MSNVHCDSRIHSFKKNIVNYKEVANNDRESDSCNNNDKILNVDTKKKKSKVAKFTCCHKEVIVDSWVINVMNCAGQDSSQDFEVSEDRLNEKKRQKE